MFLGKDMKLLSLIISIHIESVVVMVVTNLLEVEVSNFLSTHSVSLILLQ